MIVLVTPAVMDGTVVRWYRSLAAAETHRPILSASRRGVQTHNDVYLHEIPTQVMQAANAAYETLRRDPDADLKHLATHRHRGPSNGPLVPVEEADNA
ncbi:hypothetical protein [Thermoactinospora rubra]|uniref:hypothetical protein n=1 Tax=Thermoactinospora rubra TaxID=1088767 RepID=UPI000A116372|nr:hypothetical protein [Thermoactinospora rubra]